MHLRLKPTLWDGLWPPRGNRREKEVRELALEVLDFVGLASEKDERSQNISNYSRKRLGLAIALAANPCMLLIDELVSGLSAEETKGIIRHIQKIRESGVSILLVEHNMRVIMSVCDRLVVLNFGMKLTEGVPVEVVSNKDVQKAYLGGRRHA
jgi:branched-chain amino acid transport system ATP-binding protein